MNPLRLTLLVLILAAGASAAEPAAPAAAKGPLLLVAGGDSLGQGTMDATNNSVNTLNAYVQKVADSLGQKTSIVFRQPLFDFDEERLQPFKVPTNVAIDGADAFSVDGLAYRKRINSWFTLPDPGYIADAPLPRDFDSRYDRVMYPINVRAGRNVTQIDAIGEIVKGAAAQGVKRAAVLLWIGSNDTSQAALGRGGRNPEVQALPFDLIKPEIDPLLGTIGDIARGLGLVSFEPYTMANVQRGLTEELDFALQYFKIASQIRSQTALAGVDVEVFLLTLPYYSSIGYLMDSEDLEFYFRKLDPSYTVPPTFARVAPEGQPVVDPNGGDRISLLTFGLMYMLLDSGYSPAYVNQALEINGVQRDGLVLSVGERQVIQKRLDAFNETVKFNAFVQGPRFHLIDIGKTLNAALTGQTPIVVDGRELSRKWTRGGAFSADGVHPGYTGHAFIANEVLKGMNPVLGLAAPLYDLDDVAALDPYVDQDGDGFAPMPAYPASGLTEALFFLRDPDDGDPNIQAQIPANAWERISAILLEELVGIPQP